MASRRAILRMTFLVVALVLILFIGLGMIGTSLTAAAQSAAAAQEQKIAELTQQVELLSQQLVEMSENREYILILRIELRCLGGRVTLFSHLLQNTVEKEFFDRVQIGDDITDSPQIHPISNSGMIETRIFVDGKFTDNQ